jgi:hypothetical protein
MGKKAEVYVFPHGGRGIPAGALRDGVQLRGGDSGDRNNTLRPGDETWDDIPVPPPADEATREAARWLRAQLSVPQRIAVLTQQWCEFQRVPASQAGPALDTLLVARQVLGAEAFVDDSGVFMWKLPPGERRR